MTRRLWAISCPPLPQCIPSYLPPKCLRLTKQQAALVACLRGGEPVGQSVVKDLMEVYRTWDVEVEADLRWELSAPSYNNSHSDPPS